MGDNNASTICQSIVQLGPTAQSANITKYGGYIDGFDQQIW